VQKRTFGTILVNKQIIINLKKNDSIQP
jgi:hypothetical protein